MVGQLKNPDNVIVANESMFVLTVLENFKETGINYQETRS